MEIRYVISFMPSERSRKNLWPENERFQGFRIFCFFEIVAKMLKKHWFLSNSGFVEVFSSSAIAILVIMAVSQDSWYHMLRCYHTSSWQSDAHAAIAHATTTLQAIRAVTMVDGLPRAASWGLYWCTRCVKRFIFHRDLPSQRSTSWWHKSHFFRKFWIFFFSKISENELELSKLN